MFGRLRRRLTGWYLVVLAGVLIAYGLGTFLVARTVLQRSLDDTNLHALTPLLAAHARSPGSLAAVTGEMRQLGLGEGEHFALLGPDGQAIVIRGLPLDPDPGLVLGTSTHEGRGALRLLTLPLGEPAKPLGYLRVGHTLFDHYRILQSLALSLLGMVPVGLLIAWAGGNWLARKSLAPVVAAFARERQFTRDASHELRTPLAVILAHDDLALERADLPPELRDKLEVIRQTARKMQLLVDDLLTLGRLDVGIGDSGLRFTLADVVEEEVEALAPLAEARGIDLALDGELAAAALVGDPARLAQAVRNLLDNAIRYTPAGGRVRVTLAAAGPHLLLTVRDTGPGLTATDRGPIFDRFVRLGHGRDVNPEGSGLGLAIVKAIVEAHGGTVAVESRPGQGAEFQLRLPIA